jgi:radical SAM superfamily enzyme
MLILNSKNIVEKEANKTKYTEYFIEKFLIKNSNKNVLYVHTPFCLSKCKYCKYMSTCNYTEKDLDNFYNSILPAHIKLYSDIFSNIIFDEVYFGGGTPTIVDAGTLSKVFNSIPNFDKIPIKCIETSPNTLSYEHISLFQKYNFSFVSVGIQSLSKKICSKYNRFYLNNKDFANLSKALQESQLYFNYDFICFLDKGDIRDLLQFEKEIDYVMEHGKPSCITVHQYYQSIFTTERTKYLIHATKRLIEKHPNYICVNSLLEDSEVENDTLYNAEYKLVSKEYDFYHYMFNKYAIMPVEGYNILSIGYYKDQSTFSNAGNLWYFADKGQISIQPFDHFYRDNFIKIRAVKGLKL